MMAQSVLFIVIVAALLINTFPYCYAESVYCVTPNATSCSSCPHNSIHCATLSEYAQEAEMYFTSNTTLVFLPGGHTLDMNIKVANVARLTMYGTSSSDNIATVVRSGSVDFRFTDMVDVTIHSLAFTSYNKSWKFGRGPAKNSALLLQSISYVDLVNCSFHDNLGSGLTVCNTNITLTGIKFSHNLCGCKSFSESFSEGCRLGCGITAFNSNLSFTGNTTFFNNCMCNNLRASQEGAGAILAVASTLEFRGINNFVNNVNAGGHAVGVGGAIYITNYAVLAFIGTNNFINNSADNSGGAIYSSKHTVLNFTGTNNFIGNHANSGHGGAVYTSLNVVLTFNGANNFINNSGNFGGVIFAGGKISLTFIGTSYFSNNSANFGGAIGTIVKVVLTFNGTNNFTSNSAKSSGGAIYASRNVLVTFTGTNNFSGNHAHSGSGGAIYTQQNVVLTFSGTSNFISNHVNNSGGAIYTSRNVVLTITGTNTFTNNSAYIGGVMFAGINTLLTLIGTNDFSRNTAWLNGGAIYVDINVKLTFNGANNFMYNSAVSFGGAICTSYRADNDVLTFIGTNNFIGNSGRGGGAIGINNAVFTFTGSNNFINNSANRYSGGAICTSLSGNAVLTFSGTNNFTSNSADFCGGMIYADSHIVLIFNGTADISSNSANHYGGAIFGTTNVILTFNGINNFISNSAMQGGAISANRNSTLTFNGSISFTNNGNDIKINNGDNGDSSGGAIYLALNSTLSILPHTTVYLENNYATLGGAIYIADNNPFIYCTVIAAYVPQEECFFQLPGQNLSNGIDVQLVFKNNTADAAGSVLYGGAVDNCKLTGLDSHSSGEVFDMLVHIEDDTDYNTTSNISSDPLRMCLCKKNLPHCSMSKSVAYRVYPGETFQVSVVAVGQRDGVVSSNVRTINSIHFHLLGYQYLQQTNNTCTKLNYTVFSLSQSVIIELQPEGTPCSKYYDGALSFSVNLNQTCPLGFNISKSARSCVCEPRLAHYTNQCTITNGLGQITRDSGERFWVGYDNTSHALILHSHCPLDYCVSDAKVFPLNNTNVQCEYNRSGLLCGHCKEGYSQVLGTSQCKQCTNSHLVLFILFAAMGVALVFLLFVCKLTVATGTLSGLVFYANIVGVNRTIFLPVKSTSALSVFIAWLNLDFGIETCFYDGLDAYSNAWLQFVFPVYLWMLVGLLILISHYSEKFAKKLGTNPVPVLATLILLSYTKILRTLIATAFFTQLEYPMYNRNVWLLDGNIDFLIGKHIPLFLVGVIVFTFLFLPYTFLLLFGQWLQAISHLRLFSWMNSTRLKSFLDSYHAPYKAKHRYWPGLLLALRFVLLLVFTFNHQQNFSINLLAMIVASGILYLWTLVSGGVYKNWHLDALEGSFVLNLIILVGATYHVNHSGVNQLTVGYTSVSISLVTFTCILAYHIFQQLRCTKLWKKVPKLNLKLKTQQKVHNLNNPVNDSTESVNLDQLREPWLEELLQPTHSSV